MGTEQQVTSLEARIGQLEAELEDVRTQLHRAELEQWEGRIDDLEVQIHLGSMDINDRLDPLVELLRNRWLDARAQIESSTEGAGDAADALWTGLTQAMKDVRKAILEAQHSIST